MRVLTPHQFFNLNWYVSNPELTSLKPAQDNEPALAMGYVWFHVQDEVNGAEPDEDMMCAVFPWYAEITTIDGTPDIQVFTEQDDCWLSAHQFMFARDAVPSHDEYLVYFDSLNWRADVKKLLLDR